MKKTHKDHLAEAKSLRQYTIQEIKDELPRVKINVNGHKGEATIHGTRNRFATLYGKVNGIPTQCECAWETIAHCINTDSAVTW